MQTIYLDISTKGVYPHVEAKQGEVGRKFRVVITDSGVPYHPPIDAALSVWYNGRSGEGNYSSIGDRSAFIVDGNAVEVELIAEMVANDGPGVLCLTINSGDGSMIAMWNIQYTVEFVPGMGSAESTEYYTALTDAAARAAEQVGLARGEAQSAAGYAENARAHAQSAENSSVSAATSAQTASSAAENKFLEFVDKVIPVGYVFSWEPVQNSEVDLSTSEKVAAHFGFGTWERIMDVFLLSSGNEYQIGSTGGSSSHVLSVAEMPTHSHDFSGNESTHDHYTFERDPNAENAANRYLIDNFATGETVAGWRPDLSTGTAKAMLTSKASITPSGTVEEAGESQAFNTMPPYRTVYTWKRVS